MKAAVLDAAGPPSALHVREVEVPPVASGEVLIALDYSSVGIWDAHEEAYKMQMSLTQPGKIKKILRREPVLRIGYNRLCHS